MRESAVQDVQIFLKSLRVFKVWVKSQIQHRDRAKLNIDDNTTMNMGESDDKRDAVVIELLPDEHTWQVTGSARLGKRVRRAFIDADDITGFADATVVGYLPADKSDFVRCLCVYLCERVCGVFCVCASVCPRACVRARVSVSVCVCVCVRARARE
jgi:hypothetical protein